MPHAQGLVVVLFSDCSRQEAVLVLAMVGQLHIQSEHTKMERYKVNDTETKMMVFNSKSKMENSKFTMNGNIIENVETYRLLGIIRNSKMTNNTKLVEERIQPARNTAYALIGAGLYGLNGLN